MKTKENKMEDTKKECRFYRITLTAIKPVDRETGKRPEGRDTVVDMYAYGGNLPEAYVDFGDYWEEDRNGDCYLNLYADDGKELACLSTAFDYLSDNGFRDVTVPEVGELGGDRRWFEVQKPGSADELRLRVELLDKPPRISAEKTLGASELTVMAQHRIKIGGIPLFREGDVHESTALRTDLEGTINEMWRERIKERFGVEVAVKVDSMPGSNRVFTITAENREDMHTALCALGVGQPEKIVPSVEYGVGENVTAVVAKVTLASRIEG